jgi:hypothetical protein
MYSSDLIEPALFYRRRSIENAMPFAVSITARFIVGIMWVVVSSSDLSSTCLVPIIRCREAKEDARYATNDYKVERFHQSLKSPVCSCVSITFPASS